MDCEPEYVHRYTSDQKLKLFGYGEWVEEPDEIKFIYKNHPCIVLREKNGTLSGYVRMENNHPWNNKYISELPDLPILSIIDFKQKGWLGFKANETWDLYPVLIKRLQSYVPTMRRYRNMNAIMYDCEKLVDAMLSYLEKSDRFTV